MTEAVIIRNQSIDLQSNYNSMITASVMKELNQKLLRLSTIQGIF